MPKHVVPDPGVFGKLQAAAYLGVAKSTLDTMIRAGQLPGSFIIGKRWKISRVVLDELIAEWRTNGGPAA
jgi:excisionase family DNA binding protein